LAGNNEQALKDFNRAERLKGKHDRKTTSNGSDKDDDP
jgi:hypothetical protein